jgi:hypothetical protein
VEVASDGPELSTDDLDPPELDFDPVVTAADPTPPPEPALEGPVGVAEPEPVEEPAERPADHPPAFLHPTPDVPDDPDR